MFVLLLLGRPSPELVARAAERAPRLLQDQKGRGQIQGCRAEAPRESCPGSEGWWEGRAEPAPDRWAEPRTHRRNIRTRVEKVKILIVSFMRHFCHCFCRFSFVCRVFVVGFVIPVLSVIFFDHLFGRFSILPVLLPVIFCYSFLGRLFVEFWPAVCLSFVCHFARNFRCVSIFWENCSKVTR